MVAVRTADTERPALAGRARAGGTGADAYFDGSGSLQSTFGLAPM
ncbi:hypothetical protein GA0070215_103332 [Micromonospora marina]|uniref:Uncharacterized protein n=1 Tax=Micromonospora marina TaxID=307120 RepID=A0A1C4VQK2_9ACTN|nr:hypothetical protein GA0070215_103332 [Micromonospora marina]